MMKTGEFLWKTEDGLGLYCREWSPEGNSRGIICIVHGLGEHSGRYQHVAKALTEAGFVVVALDLRGHGKSHGERGHTSSYWKMLSDIAELLQIIMQKFPKMPVFLYGHSLGGNLVLNYVIRFRPPVKGVVVTSPWLKLAFEPSAAKIKLGQFMNLIWPSFAQNNELKLSGLSHDESVGENYLRDPLVHARISARLFIGAYQAGRWALEHARKFDYPLLLMHGGSDPITSAEASRNFADSLPQSKCTFKLWNGMYHELHNEVIKENVFKYEIEWFNKILRA